MRKLICLLSFACIAVLSFGQITETRKVSGFSGIDASSVFNITITKSNTETLTIEADEHVMPYVRSEVKNGTLRLYLDSKKDLKVKTLKASIGMKNLDNVKLSGACKLASNDLFSPGIFNAKLSGATGLKLAVDTRQLSIGSSGAGNITLKANVSGNTTVNMSGSSKVEIELNTDNVVFDISGASRVSLNGKCNTASFDMSGASNVKAGDFVVRSVDVRSSGASNLSIHVTESLKMRSSGASKVQYKGNPSHVDVNNSGPSSLVKMK